MRFTRKNFVRLVRLKYQGCHLGWVALFRNERTGEEIALECSCVYRMPKVCIDAFETGCITDSWETLYKEFDNVVCVQYELPNLTMATLKG
jgi:hypothetical protein